MIKKTLVIFGVGLCFSLPIRAESADPSQSTATPIYFGVAMGYGTLNGGIAQDGNFAQGRFLLGVPVKEYSGFLFSAELGLQSANSMRLSASSGTIQTAGGSPIQSTLKPVLDLLVTVKGQFKPDSAWYYFVKGGVAYRQLQLDDRTSSQDTLDRLNAELQAGLGYKLTNQMRITVFYQGIYGGPDAGVGLDSGQNITLARIPTQQAGFLGLEIY